jgi:hypothetical protein
MTPAVNSARFDVLLNARRKNPSSRPRYETAWLADLTHAAQPMHFPWLVSYSLRLIGTVQRVQSACAVIMKSEM